MIGYFIRKAFSVVIITAGILAGPASLAATLEQQREWYEQAGVALEEDNIDGYRQLREQLDGYVLTPYLDYRDFSRLLFLKTPKQVEDFINEYKSLPFSTTIKSRYLEYLADTERWQNFVEVQPMPPRGEVLKCHYYYARAS